MHPPSDPGFEALKQKAAAAQAPLVSIPDRGPWDWRVVTQYLALCRRERVAIWHGHDYKSNALGLLLRRFWPMRLVTTVHGWGVKQRRTPFYYWIDELCLPRYESVICVSEDLFARVLQVGVEPDRSILIENAIDVEQYVRRSAPSDTKSALGITPQRLVIGAVGRLSPEKGYDVLLRAAQALVQRGYDLQVVIAGGGDADSELRQLTRDLNLDARVQLLGYQAETRNLYEAMDVYVLSSHREGLPNVVLEAMAMEVPVVATRIAGVPRLISHGVNGLLVSPGSVDELAAAIRRLADNPAERARFAAAGRRTVVERYSFAVRMQKICEIYDRLLNRAPAPTQNGLANPTPAR